MFSADMPAALRRYVLAIAVGGPLLAVVVSVLSFETVSLGVWLRGLVLALLASLAYSWPLHITHKHSYDVSEVVHVAMVVLLPPWLPGLLVLAAGGLHVARRPNRTVDEFFNVAQCALYVTVGTLTVVLLDHSVIAGPSFSRLPSLTALLIALILMLLVNTASVAGAISLHARARFWRLWRAGLTSVAGTYAALVALGLVVALILRDYPLALVPLLLPVALAHHALRREVQLRADTRAALASLVEVIELRDPGTAGHSERVATLARALALRLGLPGDEADLIETAGRVHDLGKVALNPAVLLKEGPLSAAEWAQMRQHPGYGATVVDQFAGYRGCAPLVRHHHENIDGTGYPDGLAGEAIPLGARILAVADAFDALTSSRSYRSARGPKAALQIIQEETGTHWDPSVVDALVDHLRHASCQPGPAQASRPVLA